MASENPPCACCVCIDSTLTGFFELCTNVAGAKLATPVFSYLLPTVNKLGTKSAAFDVVFTA